MNNPCTCKLIIKTTAAYVYAYEKLLLCFYVLVCYFFSFLFIFENHTETIIRLRLSEDWGHIHLDLTSPRLSEYPQIFIEPEPVSVHLFFFL